MMTVHYNAQVRLGDEDNLGHHEAGSLRSRPEKHSIYIFYDVFWYARY